MHAHGIRITLAIAIGSNTVVTSFALTLAKFIEILPILRPLRLLFRRPFLLRLSFLRSLGQLRLLRQLATKLRRICLMDKTAAAFATCLSGLHAIFAL